MEQSRFSNHFWIRSKKMTDLYVEMVLAARRSRASRNRLSQGNPAVVSSVERIIGEITGWFIASLYMVVDDL